jgi:hypothetical protein
MEGTELVISVFEQHAFKKCEHRFILYPFNKYGEIGISIDSDEDEVVDRSQSYSLTIDDAKKVVEFLQKQIKDNE